MTNITPKQYATELVAEIKKEIYWGVITTADYNTERERVRTEKAKTVALLSINKTIRNIGMEHFEWWVKAKEEVIKISYDSI
jgi:hypothetical protein